MRLCCSSPSCLRVQEKLPCALLYWAFAVWLHNFNETSWGHLTGRFRGENRISVCIVAAVTNVALFSGLEAVLGVELHNRLTDALIKTRGSVFTDTASIQSLVDKSLVQIQQAEKLLL